MAEENEVYEGEVVSGALVVAGAEIDQQVATAHRFPRSIKQFRADVLDMVTLNEEVASECIFAVPRGKENGKQKFIEGASVRFAEIAVSAYGNSRCGSRPVSEEKDYIVAQGFFHDLEKNVAITVEVRRSIKNSKGQRFNADMIGVTTNAACSIARRNAILQGVPKALWKDLYDEAKKTAIGTAKTLVKKRTDMFAYFQKMNVTTETIFSFMGVAGIEDIGLDELAVLKGIATAIKEGATTIEKAFTVETGTTAKEELRNRFKEEELDAPDLQLIYRMLADLAKIKGVHPDDLVSQLTGGAVKEQTGLEDVSAEVVKQLKAALDVEISKESGDLFGK